MNDTDISPTPTISAELSPSPTPEATPEPTPEATPEPTQPPAETKEHTVVSGDTLTSIAKKYYGDDNSLVEKLGKYNEIPEPYNNIILGQKIIIPPKEELLKIR